MLYDGDTVVTAAIPFGSLSGSSMETKPLKKEQVAQKLRRLYAAYGYGRYRMSNFEEYSFYLKNKNFLSDERVVAFTDLDGRLLALKPDVTH